MKSFRSFLTNYSQLPPALSIIAIELPLLSGCDAEKISTQREIPDIGAAKVTPPPDQNSTVESSLLTGVFLDSQVVNLPYVAGEIKGSTNHFGEFNYREGDKITFSIGATKFPQVTAGPVITPLDLFNADNIEHIGVTNTLRLLQTLDSDKNPDNGIQIKSDIIEKLTDVELDLTNEKHFDSIVLEAFSNNGINITTLTSPEQALTHFANSLINNKIPDTPPLIASAVITIDPDSGEGALVDTDTDGIADLFDGDDDNDGTRDEEDAFPLDSTEFSDIDSDGIGDSKDADNDNDGFPDYIDRFPLDPQEWTDNDSDGKGDNTDTDDDNDGVPDVDDAFPLDETESSDMDSDGIGDSIDRDNDNDGFPDYIDRFPFDATEWTDHDLDGIGDNTDPDDDNDGVADVDDAFPLDENETSDMDLDGIGDASDRDNDNDGRLDTHDSFPFDPTEWSDYDLDGIGNNADTDDDNDGVADVDDALPLDATDHLDRDNDGIGDSTDTDNDNDGFEDLHDMFPFDWTEHADFDGDGIGDNEDDDDDGDGTRDYIDQWQPVFTLGLDSLFSPDTCQNHRNYRGITTGKIGSFTCYFYDAQNMNMSVPRELTILKSAIKVHGNLVQKSTDITMSFRYKDRRNLFMTVEDVLLSMKKRDSDSVKIEIPEGTQIRAQYTHTNGITHEFQLDAQADMFSPAPDGAITIDIDLIHEQLHSHGYNDLLILPGQLYFQVMFKDIDFQGTQLNYNGRSSLVTPKQTTVSIGNGTYTGYYLNGSLINNKWSER